MNLEKPEANMFNPGNSTDQKPADDQEQQDVVKMEYKNGLPVIKGSDYARLYNTDLRALGTESVATFDFQGIMREDRAGASNLGEEVYKDVIATNGILRDEEQKGVHIGTDGVSSYDLMTEKASGPENINEYDIYIIIPSKLQKKLNIVCKYDNCYSVEQYKEEWGSDESGEADDLEESETGKNPIEKEIEDAQSGEGWVVVRLGLDPEVDKMARRKAQIIHEGLVKYIESGRALHQLKEVVEIFERKLDKLNEADLKNKNKIKELEM